MTKWRTKDEFKGSSKYEEMNAMGCEPEVKYLEKEVVLGRPKRPLIKVVLASIFGVIFFAARAQATLFTEVESNNTFATAQLLSPHNGSIDLFGSRVGDPSPDFFTFFATSGNIITLAVNTGGGADDPILFLLNPVGGLQTFNDDKGTSPNPLDSLISGFPITSTGFWAADVDGSLGSSGWTYHLVITGLTPQVTIPEPNTFLLVGLGVVMLITKLRVRRS